MTSQDCEKKVEILIHELSPILRKECMRLFGSGGIDTSKFGNDYLLPKTLLSVAMTNHVASIIPQIAKSDIKNLLYF